jgi:CheY-like chemotaxis protein
MSATRVLVVDDDGDTREVLPRERDRLGFESSTCTSGGEALQLLAEQEFSAVLTCEREIGVDHVARLSAEPFPGRPLEVIERGSSST